MQVDDREPYQGAPADESVRQLTRAGRFFTDPLTAHYAGAKALVAAWREGLPVDGWNEVLARLGDGAALDAVWPPSR